MIFFHSILVFIIAVLLLAFCFYLKNYALDYIKLVDLFFIILHEFYIINHVWPVFLNLIRN